eukprot:TRINITY_DN8854_c0_g1_i1.p1 TRINITY_DN8854_c0_g1~~TRINITY_DN8854_c0_g1_i1.p1  ORF type:complete len:312 (+),score=59.67 TRINITY_DN8854_c0_g1_i1:3-938(+)
MCIRDRSTGAEHATQREREDHSNMFVRLTLKTWIDRAKTNYSHLWESLSLSSQFFKAVPHCWGRPSYSTSASDLVMPIPRVMKPSLEEFHTNYFVPSQPVILTNAMSDWKGLDKWKDLQAFERSHGEEIVTVETAPYTHHQHQDQEEMSLKRFLHENIFQQNFNDKKQYIAHHSLLEDVTELQEEFEIPDYCHVGSSGIYGVPMCIAPKDTIHPLHFDPHSALVAQVIGSQYVRIYKRNYGDHVYLYSDMFLLNTSQVDVESPDPIRFPKFGRAPYYECTLKEDEILYIPQGFFYYMKSMSTSFSVTFWFR